MRSPTACTQCQRAKRRCIRLHSDVSCGPCQRRGILCEGKLTKRLLDRRTLAPRLATTNTSRQPSQQLDRLVEPIPELPHGTGIELVENYLDKFYGRPHMIFHPASLRAKVRSGTLSRALLYAICAIGCKFSGNPDIRRLDSTLASASQRLLQADISNVCLENIQTCMLIAILGVGHGNNASEALFFRIATAQAEIMRLDSPSAGDSAIQRETRLRVWWSLYLTDIWCICGQGLQSHMRDLQVGVDLPGDEMTFMSLSPEQRDVASPRHPGIWAHMTTLVPLFGPIHNLNRLIATGDTNSINLDQEIEQLASRLDNWKRQLPAEAQMNHENLHRQQKRGLGGLLISLHLAFHHFSLLLYFRYLEIAQPASSIGRTYIDRCKAHASSFSSLLHQSRQLKGCDVVYPNIGHMATVSSSVLVHTLLFGDLDEIDMAREELNANFEALIELTQYWPATSAMIDRLVLFQDMCLLSREPGTHKLDGWMLEFLIDHSLDVAAKNTKVNPSSFSADLGRMSSKVRQLAEQGRYISFQSMP